MFVTSELYCSRALFVENGNGDFGFLFQKILCTANGEKGILKYYLKIIDVSPLTVYFAKISVMMAPRFSTNLFIN